MEVVNCSLIWNGFKIEDRIIAFWPYQDKIGTKNFNSLKTVMVLQTVGHDIALARPLDYSLIVSLDSPITELAQLVRPKYHQI